VIDILNATIAAPRAEGRYYVGAISGKNDTAMDEAIQPPALEGVDRHPVEFEVAVADHAFDARDDVFWLLFFFRIGIPAKLQIDAVDVVGLLVQQRRLTLVERR